MKKNIFSFLLAGLAVVLATSCTVEEGTEPGNDSKPVATVYQYENTANPDNNIDVRVATNNKVSEIYYLAIPEAQFDSDMTSKGEETVKNEIVQKGTKVALKDAASHDFTVTDLFGKYVIAIVATDGNTKTLTTTNFTGLDWETVATGTYKFANTDVAYVMETATKEATLQVCTTDETLFRFKDLYGEDKSLKFFYLKDYESADKYGHYYYARVKTQATGLEYGTYGPISVRDIGYWQGDDSWVTDSGYNGYYYDESKEVYLYVQYFLSALSSGNNLGYKYDSFVPNK